MTIQRCYSRPSCRRIRDPNIIEILIVVVAVPISLTGERNQVRAGLVHAREAGPDSPASQWRANDLTGHRIDLRSHLPSGHVNGEFLAIRVPKWVNHPRRVREQDRLPARINAVNTVTIAECYRPTCETPASPVTAPTG